MTEAAVQRYVIDRLTLLERTGKVYFFRNNSFTGKLMRYNGSEGFVKNGKPGMPDIVALIAGKFVGIELKSDKGRQSEEQKIAQKHIEKLGGLYLLVNSPEAFETCIQQLKGL